MTVCQGKGNIFFQPVIGAKPDEIKPGFLKKIIFTHQVKICHQAPAVRKTRQGIDGKPGLEVWLLICLAVCPMTQDPVRVSIVVSRKIVLYPFR